MRTDDSQGSPSGLWRGRAAQSVLLAIGALVLVATPARVLASSGHPVVSPIPSPACPAPPCADPPAAHLVLAETVDRANATAGGTVEYTVTVANTGTLPAAAVTIDDVMGGNAGYIVDDGTAGTTNSFAGQPVVTVTRTVLGHYRWTYPVVAPGQTNMVRFGAVIAAGRGSAARGVAVTLTSTATTLGAAPALAATTVTFPARVPGGGVRGARTSVPPTGAGLEASAVGFLLLGGLGFVLLGLHVHRRDEQRG